MKKTILFIPLLLALIFGLANAESKTALVIGNASYTHVTPLKNPVNDARDIAEELRSLGFSVILKTDAGLAQMEDGVIELQNSLKRDPDSTGLFFYAGHGVQAEGVNYLIPVDGNIQSGSQLRYRATSVDFVLDAMNEAGNTLNLVVLDACRDNPFPWSRGGSRGLAVVDRQPPGSIIMYATGAGDVASDGTGRNGLFTEKLLQSLKTPGLDVQEVFRRTGQAVQAASSGKQNPAIYSQYFGRYVVNGSSGSPAVTSGPVRKPSFTVEKAYGHVAFRTVTEGTLYMDGKRQGDIPTGGSGRMDNLETGSYTFEMRYADGKTETKRITVSKDRTIDAAFTYKPAPAAPEGFVLVETGSFTMGSPSSESGRGNSEVRHTVRITKDFYISKYEVTQAEYKSVMGSNPNQFNGDSLPVEKVSWYDAAEYCNKRSIREGLTPAYTINGTNVSWNRNANGYRLPTEAEWEYAARGGQKAGSYNVYAGSDSIGNVAWYSGNSGRRTHPVGGKQANELGLYDMSGNVWEWCWDWYGGYPSGSVTDPTGPSSGSSRVKRGGGGSNGAEDCRSASRGGSGPSAGRYYFGFRLVRLP